MPIPTELNDPSLELATLLLRIVPMPGDVRITSLAQLEGHRVVGSISAKTRGQGAPRGGEGEGGRDHLRIEEERQHTTSSAVVLFSKSETLSLPRNAANHLKSGVLDAEIGSAGRIPGLSQLVSIPVERRRECLRAGAIR